MFEVLHQLGTDRSDEDVIPEYRHHFFCKPEVDEALLPLTLKQRETNDKKMKKEEEQEEEQEEATPTKKRKSPTVVGQETSEQPSSPDDNQSKDQNNNSDTTSDNKTTKSPTQSNDNTEQHMNTIDEDKNDNFVQSDIKYSRAFQALWTRTAPCEPCVLLESNNNSESEDKLQV